jgi:cobalt-zinc-cadmium efflux system membrane fusion protein
MRLAETCARGLLAAVATAPLLMISPARAHEGHDNGPPPVNMAVAPRAEASSEAFELVAVARDRALTIYLDRSRSNAPVAGAAIEIETPEGPATAEVKGDAYRLAAPWLGNPGHHDLVFTVTTGEEADILAATLVIPEPALAAPGVASHWLVSPALASELNGVETLSPSKRLASQDPALITAGLAGFALGILVIVLFHRRGAAAAAAGGAAAAVVALTMVTFTELALAHEGHDHGDVRQQPQAAGQIGARDLAQRLPDGALFVPKPTQRILSIRTDVIEPTTHRRSVELPGRIIPDPNARGYVQAAVSGRLSPPANGFPSLGAKVAAGDVLAYVTAPLSAAETSDQRQRQGELDQQISIVERRIARFETLDKSGAVSRTQLEEAQIELHGLKDRRTALDRARRDPEALVAPVSGVVAAAKAVAGQIADANAIVFEIVDPAQLWIEALSFEAMAGANGASARDAEGHSLALSFQGSGFADRNQAIPVHFRIEDDTKGLRPGQLVTVLVETKGEREGLAVPRTSVLRGPNGQTVVYEHASAERFEAREVRIEPLDGERVLIAAGLEPDKRVVTQGAELLNQIR